MATRIKRSTTLLLVIVLIEFILLGHFYDNQGIQGYIYIPLQILLVSFFAFLSTYSIGTVKYAFIVFGAIVSILLIRGSDHDRTPQKDLINLLAFKNVNEDDLLDHNSLIRSLAVYKFNVTDQYYSLSYYPNGLRSDVKTIVFRDNLGKYEIKDTVNFALDHNCLIINDRRNDSYCFTDSLQEISYNADSLGILIFRSDEISPSYKIDRYLIELVKCIK